MYDWFILFLSKLGTDLALQMHPCWAALPLPSVHLRFPPPHQYDCPIYHRLSWGQSHSGVNGTQTGLSELFYIYFMNWVYWNFKLCRMFAWRCGGERGKSWAFKAFSYYKPHSATNTNTHKSFFPISKSFNIAFTLRHMHQFGVQYISQGYFGGLIPGTSSLHVNKQTNVSTFWATGEENYAQL